MQETHGTATVAMGLAKGIKVLGVLAAVLGFVALVVAVHGAGATDTPPGLLALSLGLDAAFGIVVLAWAASSVLTLLASIAVDVAEIRAEAGRGVRHVERVGDLAGKLGARLTTSP